MATPPPGFRFPDFLNLGLAPPPPRGATAVAPRAHFVAPFRFAAPLPRVPRGFTPLLLPAYFLPVGPIIPGQWFTPNGSFPLLPNPYTSSQG